MADPADGTEISQFDYARPMIWPMLRGPNGAAKNGGVGPLRSWLKQQTYTTQDYLYFDAFRLPQMPKPVVFALMKKLQPIHPKSIPLPAATVSIVGVSRDSVGVALGSCTCTLFKVRTVYDAAGTATITYTQVATTVSDGSGNYSFVVGFDGPYRVTFDKGGAPILAGITLNSLSGA